MVCRLGCLRVVEGGLDGEDGLLLGVSFEPVVVVQQAANWLLKHPDARYGQFMFNRPLLKPGYENCDGDDCHRSVLCAFAQD